MGKLLLRFLLEVKRFFSTSEMVPPSVDTQNEGVGLRGSGTQWLQGGGDRE